LKILRHEEIAHLPIVSPKKPPKEWLMEVERSSKAIQILSPSTTIPCSLRGIDLEALQNPTVGTSIISEFLAKHLLGNMPLVPTNQLFKSPLGLFFECCGIARVVPVIIDKTKVHLDFHIYAILEFDLLIGHPLENLILENLPMGALMKSLGKLLLPLLPFAQKVQRQSSNPIITRSRRQNSYLCSFHLSLLMKQNVYHPPHLNPSRVPLAIQTLFSIVDLTRKVFYHGHAHSTNSGD
jgi:hypothetical protein